MGIVKLLILSSNDPAFLQTLYLTNYSSFHYLEPQVRKLYDTLIFASKKKKVVSQFRPAQCYRYLESANHSHAIHCSGSSTHPEDGLLLSNKSYFIFLFLFKHPSLSLSSLPVMTSFSTHFILGVSLLWSTRLHTNSLSLFQTVNLLHKTLSLIPSSFLPDLHPLWM